MNGDSQQRDTNVGRIFQAVARLSDARVARLADILDDRHTRDRNANRVINAMHGLSDRAVQVLADRLDSREQPPDGPDLRLAGRLDE